MYQEKFPDSEQKMSRFINEFFIPDTLTYHLVDFILVYQKKDFCIMSDVDAMLNGYAVFVEDNILSKSTSIFQDT